MSKKSKFTKAHENANESKVRYKQNKYRHNKTIFTFLSKKLHLVVQEKFLLLFQEKVKKIFFCTMVSICNYTHESSDYTFYNILLA